MKEIMLLLAEFVKQTVALESVFSMLKEEFLLGIGDFFVDIFIRSKHRGVFEQAHVAFSVICDQFGRSVVCFFEIGRLKTKYSHLDLLFWLIIGFDIWGKSKSP